MNTIGFFFYGLVEPLQVVQQKRHHLLTDQSFDQRIGPFSAFIQDINIRQFLQKDNIKSSHLEKKTIKKWRVSYIGNSEQLSCQL